MELTDNSLATLLLCSTLARDSTVPPLTDSVYEFLARELYARGLEPSDLLTRPPMWPQTEVPGWEMPLRVV